MVGEVGVWPRLQWFGGGEVGNYSNSKPNFYQTNLNLNYSRNSNLSKHIQKQTRIFTNLKSFLLEINMFKFQSHCEINNPSILYNMSTSLSGSLTIMVS